MDYIKTISELCAIVEKQNTIIRDQAMELAQHGAMARENEIRGLRRAYVEITGEPHTEGEQNNVY